MAAVSRITSNPCHRDGTPAFGCAVPWPASRPLVARKKAANSRALARAKIVTRTKLSHWNVEIEISRQEATNRGFGPGSE